MINHCFNPACNKELRYLRDGRVVRVIRGKDEDASMEHFWLCGNCYQYLDFVFPADGTVILGNKSRGEHEGEFHFRDVLLPERRSGNRPPGEARKPAHGLTSAAVRDTAI